MVISSGSDKKIKGRDVPLKKINHWYQEEILKGLVGNMIREILDYVLVLVTVLSINIWSSRLIYLLGMRKQKENF